MVELKGPANLQSCAKATLVSFDSIRKSKNMRIAPFVGKAPGLKIIGMHFLKQSHIGAGKKCVQTSRFAIRLLGITEYQIAQTTMSVVRVHIDAIISEVNSIGQ